MKSERDVSGCKAREQKTFKNTEGLNEKSKSKKIPPVIRDEGKPADLLKTCKEKEAQEESLDRWGDEGGQ